MNLVSLAREGLCCTFPSHQGCVCPGALRSPSVHPGVCCTPAHPAGISGGFRPLSLHAASRAGWHHVPEVTPGALSLTQCQLHMAWSARALLSRAVIWQGEQCRTGLVHSSLLPVLSVCRTHVSLLILELLMKLRSSE